MEKSLLELKHVVTLRDVMLIAFFGTPEKPISFNEFAEFWDSLTDWEKHEVFELVQPLPGDYYWQYLSQYSKDYIESCYDGVMPNY